MPRRSATVVLAALALVAAPLAAAAPAAAGPVTVGPVIVGAGHPAAVDGRYIVVYKNSRADLTATPGITVTQRYTAPPGFAGAMDESTALELAADPAVAFVEQDRVMSTGSRATPDATQPNPPNWGIDRIDQPTLPLNNSYTYGSTAANVHAYVIDTGIYGHSQLMPRVVGGVNTTRESSAVHCDGRGTHYAGIVGGVSTGVAKQITLVPVKAVPCGLSSLLSEFVAGVNWVTGNHVKPAVAVIGATTSSSSPAVDLAVNNSIAAGVHYSVAAGNSGANACGFSPAGVPAAFTVGATAINDTRPAFSNVGPCIDLYAPGVNIYSTGVNSGSSYFTVAGTGQAASFAAGVAAQYLSGNPTATPAQVSAALIAAATVGVLVPPAVVVPNRLLRTIW